MMQCKFYIKGIHCPACKLLIEDIVYENKDISYVAVHIKKQTIELVSEVPMSEEDLIQQLNAVLKPHNYSVLLDKSLQKKDYASLTTAVPIGLFILVLFFLLQKSGALNLGFTGDFTIWTAFIIGIVASLSSCLAIVGGLILSLSAKVSHDTGAVRPFVLFHGSRVLSFIIFGAVLGAAGSALAINYTITAILGLLAALVMVIVGINLLDVFEWPKYMQLTLPGGLHKKIISLENSTFAPVLVGASTFFLPCGFTQSMQLAALSSGSLWHGSAIMLMFAIGTLPMLVLISFSSFQFSNTKYAAIFYKTAGTIVIGLGIFGFLSGLAGLGFIRPLFNF